MRWDNDGGAVIMSTMTPQKCTPVFAWSTTWFQWGRVYVDQVQSLVNGPMISIVGNLQLVAEGTLGVVTVRLARPLTSNSKSFAVRAISQSHSINSNTQLFWPSLITRKRSALTITLTEDNDMAAAAKIGDRSMPANGYKTPAAMGTPAAL